ncbi:MAG: glycosyltransferase family 4 protein [Leptolyngbyaceae cyanobacterium SU_3_3]|nr:glycosyltransferase family 4 protein [Leptolyngbyaceae cyanobacterium SU_3_3]
MSKRIILLTQWFQPEPNPRGIVFARELVKRGYEVEVITGFPNYPGGKVYPGYKIKLLQRELVDGVQITRLPLYPSHGGSAVKRLFNYLSFALSATVYGVLFAKKADMMHVYQPPGVSAALIRLFRRIPVVYDVQDMWPDTLAATGMVRSERLLKVVYGICQWVFRTVDKISVLSPGFKRLLIERGVPSEKIEVIYNWCDEAALTAPVGGVPKAFPTDDKFNLLFAGTMGKAQALDGVIAAAEIVQAKQPNVNFVFVGGGIEVDRLKQLVQSKHLQNVVFIPKVPMDEVGAMLQQADVLLVHLKNDPLFSMTVPSKLQAYLAVGKPILMAVTGDSSAIVDESKCGLSAIPEDPQSIADAVIQLSQYSSTELQAMGQRGKDFYHREMALDVGVNSFEQILTELPGGSLPSNSSQLKLREIVRVERT